MAGFRNTSSDGILSSMNLTERADASYFQGWRVFGRNSPGFVVESNGLLAAASGLEVAFLNILFVTRPLSHPRDQISESAQAFDSRNLPFVVRIRERFDAGAEAACETLGMPYSDTVPGMASHQMTAPAAPAVLEIRIVESEVDRRDFCSVIAGGFGVPVAIAEQLVTAGLLRDPESESYVGYAEGQAVASSTLCFGGRTAGVYNVATMPGFRKRGFGEALTWQAISRGASFGCDLAVLQASEMGQPIYERMGFRTVARYKTFHRPGI